MSLSRAVAMLALAACGAAFAQTAVVPDGPRTPSLPEAAFERVDGALRDRVAASDAPEAHFVRGLQATMDPGARIADYAAAYRLKPGEFLFLASLADACMVRAVPNWPDCASLDPASRWASRDADNAAPRVLLAERARARGDLSALREQVIFAAGLARFDSYRPRGGAVVWSVLQGVASVAGEPESPFAAAAIAAARANIGTVEAATACRRDGPAVTPELGEACRGLARTMADRADTWEAREVGLAILWSWTDDSAARSRLVAERTAIEASNLSCNRARLALIEALNRDAGSRAAARAIELAAIDDAAKLGEPAACAKLVERTRDAKFL